MGPGYCRACMGRRDSEEPCADCPEPALFVRNAALAQLLLACSTQWRVGATGMPTGLDYQGVEIVARRYAIELPPEEFARFQHLEREYLKGLHDGRNRNAAD